MIVIYIPTLTWSSTVRLETDSEATWCMQIAKLTRFSILLLRGLAQIDFVQPHLSLLEAAKKYSEMTVKCKCQGQTVLACFKFATSQIWPWRLINYMDVQCVLGIYVCYNKEANRRAKQSKRNYVRKHLSNNSEWNIVSPKCNLTLQQVIWYGWGPSLFLSHWLFLIARLIADLQSQTLLNRKSAV